MGRPLALSRVNTGRPTAVSLVRQTNTALRHGQRAAIDVKVLTVLVYQHSCGRRTAERAVPATALPSRFWPGSNEEEEEPWQIPTGKCGRTASLRPPVRPGWP